MSGNRNLATQSLSEEDYHELVVYEATRILQTLAWEEVHRNNRKPAEFILFCIEGDSSWSSLLEQVNQRSDWQKVQSQKINPIFYGVATEAFFEEFKNLLPNKAEEILNTAITSGFVKALVCTKSAVEIMQVKPNNFGSLM